MRGISPIIGFVLTIFMTIMVTTLTFTVIKPSLERNRGFNVINEASVNLELLSSTINEVATEAEGSRRTITLTVSDGEYLIDKNSNNIIFTFEPGVDLGVIGRIGDKFLEKGLVFFDFFNSYLDNSLPKNLINVSGNWRVFNNRLEGINGTAYYFIDKILNGFYVVSNFGSDNNLGQIYVSPVNLSELVLYLTFDEGSGDIVYDYSGNGNSGNLYDANSTNDDENTPPQWVDGRFGKALSFDGADDYVESKDIDLQTSFTLMAWIHPFDVSNAGTIISKTGETINDTNYWMDVRNNGMLYFGVYDENGDERYVYTAEGTIAANKWTHVTGSYNGSIFRIYVNGMLRPENFVWSGIIKTNDYKVRIGYRGLVGNPFNGIVDEVLIFNRALSEEEIKFLYEEGLKKLQNSGMVQFNSRIKPCIAISNPSGKIYVDNLRVGNQNSKEIKLIKPLYNLELESNFRFSKGTHQIKIENVGFNFTSKRPIIRISEK